MDFGIDLSGIGSAYNGHYFLRAKRFKTSKKLGL
tara:strand:+ start:725 stop:826 length:102 start_codon:yes stop_codon:yes gene_type:complete